VRVRWRCCSAPCRKGPGWPKNELAAVSVSETVCFFLPALTTMLRIFLGGVPGAVGPPGWSGACVLPSVHAGTTPVSAGTPIRK